MIIRNSTPILLNNFSFSSESNNLKEGFLGLKKSLGWGSNVTTPKARLLSFACNLHSFKSLTCP